jgi:RecJ-like exonuclease
MTPQEGLVAVVSHGDCDGLTSASIALRKYPKAKLMFAQPSTLTKKLDAYSVKNASLLLILDMAVDQRSKPELLRKLNQLRQAGTKVIYIDHHRSSLDEDLSKSVDKLICVCDEKVSSSYLTAQTLEVEAPDLVILGMLGDKALKDTSHPMFRLSELLRAGLSFQSGDEAFKRHVVKLLVSDPEELLEDAELNRRARLAQEIYRELLKKAKQRISYEDDRWAFVDFTDYFMHGFGGHVANDLAEERGKAVFLMYKPRNVSTYLTVVARSCEGSDVDCDNILSKLAMEFGGSGGGHRLAAGARIPASKSSEFFYRLKEELSS